MRPAHSSPLFALAAIAAGVLAITAYIIAGARGASPHWSRPLWQGLILVGLFLATPLLASFFRPDIEQRWKRVVLVVLTLIVAWFALQIYALALYGLLTGDGP